MAGLGKKMDEVTHKAMMEQQDLDIKYRLQHIGHKLLVMSGKGGVGKSSLSAYLAVSLADRGYSVGLMDVDMHGPSIPRLLGLEEGVPPNRLGDGIYPVKYMPNLEVISMQILTGERDAATIWRGPIKGGVIRQFISDIQWMDLDYMIIDSPPGTGDEPLTIAQTIPEAKAIIVTTPQEISLADVRKSINFCRQVKMDILGLVENMSGLVCPKCGDRIDLFGTNGGRLTAEKENLPLLGCLPLDPYVVVSGDSGNVEMLKDQTNPFTRSFKLIADEVEKRLGTMPRFRHLKEDQAEMHRMKKSLV